MTADRPERDIDALTDEERLMMMLQGAWDHEAHGHWPAVDAMSEAASVIRDKNTEIAALREQARPPRDDDAQVCCQQWDTCTQRCWPLIGELRKRLGVPRGPYLGLATTRQLIDELAARAEVSQINGESWPSYRTVGPEPDATPSLAARSN